MTSPTVTRRAITPADDAFLAALYASTRAEELAPVPWSDAQKQAFLRSQFDAQTAHYAQHYADRSTFELVLVDGAPAGRLIVHRGERDVRIVDISLMPAFRGRGVGSGLLAALIAEVEAAGKSLSIHVEYNNPALRLYTRSGFVKVGEHGVSWLMERVSRR